MDYPQGFSGSSTLRIWPEAKVLLPLMQIGKKIVNIGAVKEHKKGRILNPLTYKAVPHYQLSWMS